MACKMAGGGGSGISLEAFISILYCKLPQSFFTMRFALECRFVYLVTASGRGVQNRASEEN